MRFQPPVLQSTRVNEEQVSILCKQGPGEYCSTKLLSSTSLSRRSRVRNLEKILNQVSRY